MVHFTVKFALHILAFAFDLNALHHAPLQLLTGVGVGEGLEDKPALVVPFLKRSVQHFVSVRVLRGRPFFAVPFGEGSIDANGFQQSSVAVTVNVLEAPIFEVKFPDPFLCAVQVVAVAHSASVSVKRLERTVKGALAVVDPLPQQPVVVPSLPLAVHLALDVVASLANSSTWEKAFLQAVLLSPVVVNRCGQRSFGREQVPNSVSFGSAGWRIRNVPRQSQGFVDVSTFGGDLAIWGEHRRI